MVIIVFKSYEELERMSKEEIKLEMLELWHYSDFANMTEEEDLKVMEQLRMCRDIISERHNNKYF
mgnify:CR=1 FL=1